MQDRLKMCPNCTGTKIYNHGKTQAGSKRVRCSDCGKTWVLGKNNGKFTISIAKITEEYLQEKSLRELVRSYKGSPMRYNQKIREFIDGCPHWEDYLDANIESHFSKMIYLVEKQYSCYGNGPDAEKSNKMVLSIAVDALSSVILGYETTKIGDNKRWSSLLKRLKKRGITSPNFLSMSNSMIEEAVSKVYPESVLKINHHKSYRDRELKCCLNRIRLNSKLVNDASKFFDSYANDNLKKFLSFQDSNDIKKSLFFKHEDFLKKIRNRMDNLSMINIDGLMLDFDVRFGKFHLLRENPKPLINSWIACKMMEKTELGFSRVSYYSQMPSKSDYADFACGNVITPLELSKEDENLRDLLVELAARSVELPIVAYECELDLDRCAIL